MTEETILTLHRINKEFYDLVGSYFDNSRQYAWSGWQRIYAQVMQQNKNIQEVLDVGCGNGRFYEFLEKNNFQGEYLGLDANDYLIAQAKEKGIAVQKADIVQGKLELDKTYDLIVLFGVMHHIPSFKKRVELLHTLKGLLKENGVLVVSFWNFLDDQRIARKIIGWDKIGVLEDLEKNDYLLSWDRGVSAVRYCHYFASEEINRLVEESRFSLLNTFTDEGKNNTLNTYLTLQV